MGLDRTGAWITVAVSAVVLAVLAGVLVPWDWVPGGSLRPAAPEEVFTPREIARAEAYAEPQRWLGWSSYAVSLSVSVVLGLTPLGARLVRRLFGARRWWLVVPAAVLLVLALGRLATLPLTVAARRRDLAYGLTEQTWDAWLVDYVKSLGVSWVVTSLVLLALVALARWSQRRWFLWAGGVAAGLAYAGSYLYPVVLQPLFNDFEPLQEGPLRASVLRLAQAEGVQVDTVLVSDASRRTTTLNAYVSGIGDTRRVVLYDNTVEQMSLEEAQVIVAHELAHAKHQDVLVGTTLGAAGAVLGTALLALALDSRRVRRRADIGGAADPAAVPVVLALAAVAMLAVSPVESSISRAVEARADRTSLAVTGQSDTFVAMQRELALSSLRDPTPPAWSQFWFGSHPTVLQRAGLPASLEAAE